MMKTVDVHTHLLNLKLQFDRLLDGIAVRFFAKALFLSQETHKLDFMETTSRFWVPAELKQATACHLPLFSKVPGRAFPRNRSFTRTRADDEAAGAANNALV